MNREEILNMPAGREMDALVAEWVMDDKGINDFVVVTKSGRILTAGATRFHAQQLLAVTMGADRYENRIRYKPYSTDIAAAWEVVEKMHEMGLCLIIWTRNKIVQVYSDMDDEPLATHVDYLADVKENTIPLAICRATLLATSVENG